MKDFDFDSLLCEDNPAINPIFTQTLDYTNLADLENSLNNDYTNIPGNKFDYKQETVLFMLAYWDRKIQTKKRIENEKEIEQMFSEYGVNVRASKHALNQLLKTIQKTSDVRKSEEQHNMLVSEISEYFGGFEVGDE